MASRALQVWQQVVDELSSCVALGSIHPNCKDNIPELILVAERIQQIKSQPQSAATWKALIQDMQVSGYYCTATFIHPWTL
jgi:hypothetical protein